MIENVYIGQNNLAKQVDALYLGTEGEATKLFEDSVEVITWANGTDEQIAAMLQAHYAGEIDIHDYWSVGDERVVNLSAMAATGVGETHEAQSVTLVLSNAGGKYLADGVTECAFQWEQKNCLLERGYMNSSNTNQGGWKNSARRAWCNNVYYNAIPATLRPIFKQHINQSGKGGGSSSGVDDTTDYIALRAEIEIFGSRTSSVEGEGSQVAYYQTSANRVKKLGDAGSTSVWWERSPCSGNGTSFCRVAADGGAGYASAGNDRGLSVCGCI